MIPISDRQGLNYMMIFEYECTCGEVFNSPVKVMQFPFTSITYGFYIQAVRKSIFCEECGKCEASISSYVNRAVSR